MYQEPAVNEIENTRRQMYADLKRFESMVGSTHLFKTLQDSLEAHLEELRLDRVKFTETRRDDLERRLSAMTEERDQIQQRLHAIDHAYCEQSNRAGAQAREIERLNELNRITGQELIRVQGIARQHLDDCRSAEKMTDDLHEKLMHATTVIGQQEQLIAGQRSAISGMHAELTHSRVIRKAFIRAQEAFTAVDAALHESAPYNAQKALGDDLVDAEFMP